MASSDKNALIIWDRCGDYHIARWQNLVSKNIFSNVFLANLGSSDSLYKWETASEDVIVLSKEPVNKSDIFRRVGNFNAVLKSHNIEYVLISGYGRVEYILFILLARIKNKKVILFAESWYDKKLLTKFLKRIFITIFIDGLFVSGKRALNHFRNEIGLKSIPIETGYSAIDNDHFAPKSMSCYMEILCVARYSEEKNLFSLINAFRKSKAYLNYKLVLIGDGSQREDLLSEVAKDNGKIVLEKWKSYDELPHYYNKAKLFILPSVFEPWGLVVNEAMAAGKPVLLSKQCGCMPDFLDDKFGFVFDAKNETDIVNKIDEAASLSPTDYKNQSQYMLQRIAKYDLNNWSNKLKKIIDQC